MSTPIPITMTVAKKGKKYLYTVTMPDGSIQTRVSGHQYLSCLVLDYGEGNTGYNGNAKDARFIVGTYSSKDSPSYPNSVAFTRTIVRLANPDFFM